MKLPILMAGGLLTAFAAGAQNFQDAARFSQLTSQSTARSMGIGGAVGAVGADFGALSVNPAGIGLYRRGEFSFSPSIRANRVDGDYLGISTEEQSGAFSISNIGLVSVSGAADKQRSSGWRSWGYAVGLNRVADFNRTYFYRGQSTSNAGAEFFALDATQNSDAAGQIISNPDNGPEYGYLAYENYLIDYDSVQGQYRTYADSRQGPLNQQRTVRERGGISELLFSFGGNRNERLMIGGTVGLPFVRYTRESTFTESDANNSIVDFAQYQFSEGLRTTGLGINLKLGVIFKPSDAFRFGVAVHTPTWMSLQDQYNANMENNSEGYHGTTNSSIPQYDLSYSIRTAWRGVLSATAFAGRWGFISADYEYVGYKNARVNYETTENQAAFGVGYFSTTQRIVNEDLKANLVGASNFRIGGEGHLDNFYFRAGVGFYSSPYKNDFFSNGRTDYAAGIGFRGQRSFIDMAVVQSQYKNSENPYVLDYVVPVANLTNSLTNLTVTVGTKF